MSNLGLSFLLSSLRFLNVDMPLDFDAIKKISRNSSIAELFNFSGQLIDLKFFKFKISIMVILPEDICNYILSFLPVRDPQYDQCIDQLKFLYMDHEGWRYRILNSAFTYTKIYENNFRHIALRQDHYEVAVLFLMRGANLKVKNKNGQEPVEVMML